MKHPSGRLGISLLYIAAGCVVPACGEPSPDKSPLVRIDPEAAGARCPSGGTAVQIGLDDNEDGVLQDAEITSTDYVCDNPTTLLRAEPEPIGDNCPTGGAAVLSGPDTNGDGVLAAEESTSTSYVCNGSPLTGADATLDGVFTVENSFDVSVLAAYEEVGAIRIVSTTLSSVELPRLRSTVGNLEIVGNYNLASFSFPNLETVGGDLRIRSNRLLTNLNGTARINIVGTILIDANEHMVSIDALCSITVVPNIFITDNPQLPTCAAENLVACVGSVPVVVAISGNDDAGTCP